MKIKIKYFWLLILFPLFSISGQPGNIFINDIAAFKSGLAKATAQTQTIESDFVQEKVMSVLSETIKSKGKFCFKKANKLRWEYHSPFRYLIVLNGDKVTVKDDNKTNRFDTKSNQMFKKITDIMTSCIQGNISDSKDFEVSYLENYSQYILRLSPKSKSMRDFFSSIHIYLDKKDFSVQRLQMYENSEDYTIITFSGKKINKGIPDEKFIVK